MSERWLPVPGFDGLYDVSSLGRVRSYARPRARGGIRKLFRCGPMAYLAVDLYFDGKRTRRYVHQLVLEAFVGPCPVGHEACHGASGKLVNHVTNLRWGTRQSNHADKHRDGTHLYGSRIGNSKLNERDVQEIISARKAGETGSALAARYGVSETCIYKIDKKVAWKHVERRAT